MPLACCHCSYCFHSQLTHTLLLYGRGYAGTGEWKLCVFVRKIRSTVRMNAARWLCFTGKSGRRKKPRYGLPHPETCTACHVAHRAGTDGVGGVGGLLGRTEALFYHQFYLQWESPGSISYGARSTCCVAHCRLSNWRDRVFYHLQILEGFKSQLQAKEAAKK